VADDIVKRLGSILDSEMSPTERAVICAAAAEIERLRKLGDDMAYWYENLGPSMTMRDAVEAWKEARRER
jgi:hypothetical protein